MTVNVVGNVNSAILSGAFGLQKASNGIANAAIGITNVSLEQQQASLLSTNDVLTNAAFQQIGLTGKLLSGVTGGDSLTSNLVSLTTNLYNAQAAAKVVDVANDTVGKLINELA